MDALEKILDELRKQRGYIERGEHEKLFTCIENIQAGIDEISAAGMPYAFADSHPFNEMAVEIHKLIGMNIDTAEKKLNELRDRIKVSSACGLYVDRQG